MGGWGGGGVIKRCARRGVWKIGLGGGVHNPVKYAVESSKIVIFFGIEDELALYFFQPHLVLDFEN